MSREENRGLIIATQASEIDVTQPVSLFKIGGISLLERQLRSMMRLGINSILIISNEHAKSEIDSAIKKKNFRRLRFSVLSETEVKRAHSSVFQQNGTSQLWVVMDGSLLFDSRFPEILMQTTGNKICLISQNGIGQPAERPKHALLYKSKRFVFSGCARLSSQILSNMEFSEPGKWLLKLQEVINDDPESQLDLSLYRDPREKIQEARPFVWMPIEVPEDNAKAKNILVHSAQRKVLDWPAWFIHRPIANWLVYRICEWPITPNQVTTLANISAFAALFLFAFGKIGLGLFLAALTGLLDGVDGKMARVKGILSKAGEFEHVLDKVYENGWLLAMAFFLSHQGYGMRPWLLSGTVVFANLADIVVAWAFLEKLGMRIDTSGAFERRFRWVSGRRNIYTWTLIPFAILNLFYEGLWFIAFYALATIIVKLWRLIVHFNRKSRGHAREQ